MNESVICSLTGKALSEKNTKIAILPNGAKIPIHKDYLDIFQKSYFITKQSLEDDQSDDSTIPEEITIQNPREIYNTLCERVIGQEIAKKKVSVAVHRHYISLKSNDPDKEWRKSNLLFIGDTGCGKTHIARTIAKMIQVPFVIGDCTQITEAGYVGDDAEVVLSTLLSVAGSVKNAERGIIMLDEIDKIAKKSGGNPSITRDVGGEGVQTSLLKMVEGTIAHVQNISDGKRKNPQAKTIPLDTENILFIAAGVFPGIEDVIAKRLNVGGKIGFRGEAQIDQEKLRENLLSQINAQDIIDYGFISEFVGRFPVIIPFEKLTKEHMIQILTSIKGSLYEQSKWIFSQNGINLQISETSLDVIADAAVEDSRGARALQSILESILMEVYFDKAGQFDGDLLIPDSLVVKKTSK